MRELNDTNLGIGAVYDTPEEKEIERLKRQIGSLRAELAKARADVQRMTDGTIEGRVPT